MIKILKKYFKYYKFHFIFGPLFKVLEAICQLMVPFIVKDIIDNGVYSKVLLNNNEKIQYIIQRGGILLAFALGSFITTMIAQYIASRASQGVGTRLRDDLYTHINTLSYKEIDKLTTSKLINSLQNDTLNVQRGVAMVIRLLIRAPLMVIGSTVLSYIINVKAGIIFTITTIVLFLAIYIITHFMIPYSKKSRAKMDDVIRITNENLKANRLIRAFNKQKYEYRRFVDAQIDLVKVQTKYDTIEALLNPITFGIAYLAIIIVLYVSGVQFSTGSISKGDIQALINYLTEIQIEVFAVTNLAIIFTKASVSANRINEMFDMKNSMIYGDIKSIKNENEVINFHNVSFKYGDNSNNTLSNINLTINKGEMVGIIGSTASGKTSLINLINRFYDINDGELSLFGEDIKKYDRQYLNSLIGLVPQKAVLFSGSIKDNLLKANKTASDEQIKKSIELAMAGDFVNKYDDNFNHILYQAGKNLSGGQKQRLTIARALIKQPKILILDDSSSALDYKTERELYKNIRSLDMTTIIVSQRVNNIMNLNRIIVIDNGKIEAIGNHNDLIKNSKTYQDICYSQDIGVNHA